MPQQPQDREVEQRAKDTYNQRRVREGDRNLLLGYSSNVEGLKRAVIDAVEAEYTSIARDPSLNDAQREIELAGLLEEKIAVVVGQRMRRRGMTDPQAIEFLTRYLFERQDWFTEDGQTHYGPEVEVETIRGDPRGEKIKVKLPRWNYRTEVPNWSFGIHGSNGRYVDEFLAAYEAREMEKERKAAREALAREQRAAQQRPTQTPQQRIEAVEAREREYTEARERQIEERELSARAEALEKVLENKKKTDKRNDKRKARAEYWKGVGRKAAKPFSWMYEKITDSPGKTGLAIGAGLIGHELLEVGAPYGQPYTSVFNFKEWANLPSLTTGDTNVDTGIKAVVAGIAAVFMGWGAYRTWRNSRATAQQSDENVSLRAALQEAQEAGNEQQQ